MIILNRSIPCIFAGAVHKSTLISMLNADPQLSKDRLKRVRFTGTVEGTQPSLTPTVECRTEVSLFSDVAIFVKDRAGPAEYRLGRVQRIRNEGSRGMIEYKRPVAIADTDKFPKLRILVSMYEKRDSLYVFTAEKVEFTLWNIAMGVKLEYQPDSDTYVLDCDDQADLATFLQQQAPAVRTKRQASRKRNTETLGDAEGRMVTTVTPEASTEGCRRSRRTRRVVAYSDFV
jgi:hypothetical protein